MKHCKGSYEIALIHKVFSSIFFDLKMLQYVSSSRTVVPSDVDLPLQAVVISLYKLRSGFTLLFLLRTLFCVIMTTDD